MSDKKLFIWQENFKGYGVGFTITVIADSEQEARELVESENKKSREWFDRYSEIYRKYQSIYGSGHNNKWNESNDRIDAESGEPMFGCCPINIDYPPMVVEPIQSRIALFDRGYQE